MIYFFDSDKKYIGCRELNAGESVPACATKIYPQVGDGQQAHFIDGVWVLSNIPIDETIKTPAEPTTDEVLDNLITTLVDKGVLY